MDELEEKLSLLPIPATWWYALLGQSQDSQLSFLDANMPFSFTHSLEGNLSKTEMLYEDVLLNEL